MQKRRVGQVVALGVRVLAIAAVTAGLGCGLDEVKIPTLNEPASFATGVRISATPSMLMADGQSTSVVVVTVSGPDGKPAAGRVVYLRTGDEEGNFARVGTLSAERLTTDSRGRVTATFTAPRPEDFGTTAEIGIYAQVAGERVGDEDVRAAGWKFATVELIAVGQRRWPEGESATPRCHFVMEPRWGPWYAGMPIRFQTRSYDPDGYIVTYFWRFRDEDTTYHHDPDLYHTYADPGTYNIFHSVLDNSGHVDSCTLTIEVVAAP